MRLPIQTMRKLGFELVRQSKTSITLKYVKNGLTVVLMPDKLSTVVTSNLIYLVGSAHEEDDEAGMAHLFEHLQFKDTKKHNKQDGTGFDALMRAVGAEWNATTSYDRTHYYETGSPELLELFLDIESDRMRNTVLRQSDFDSEMPVVLQEFARGENSPREALDKAVRDGAYTKDHPYQHPVIGFRETVFNTSMEKLQVFYDKFYWPNNAVLVIFGQFKMVDALKLIAQYFGNIPASPNPIPKLKTVKVKQNTQNHVKVERAGDNEITHLFFHTPPASHQDTPALDLVASILGSYTSRNSRLYKRLLKEKQLANVFGCYNQGLRLTSSFEIIADVMEGSSAPEVERIVFEEIKGLKTALVSDEELKLNKESLCKGLTLAMIDPENKLFYTNEAIASSSLEDFEKHNELIQAVTKEDIRRVVKKYLRKKNSTVGHFYPKKSSNQVEESSKQEDGVQSQAMETPVAQAEDESNSEVDQFHVALPAYLKKKKKGSSAITTGLKKVKMSNGLTLLILPRPKTGVVSISGYFGNAGTFFAPDNEYVPVLTSQMLIRGSEGLDADTLDARMEEMGSGLTIRTGGLSSSFVSNVVKEDLSKFVQLLGTVLRKPEFAEEELKQCQVEQAQGLLNIQSDTGSQARIKMSQSLYPEGHLFHMIDVEPSIKQLIQITKEDLAAFHKEAYGSTTTTFMLVGDITAEEASALFEKTFSDWSGNAPRTISIDEVSAPAQARRVNVNIPDKQSTNILIGHPVAIQANSPDLLAAMLGNSALGGGPIDSKLGQDVREKHGLTYGIGSAFDDLSVPYSPWLIRLTVDPNKVELALSRVQSVVSTYLKGGIDNAELEAEKGRAQGMFAVKLANPTSLAATLLSYEASGKGAEYVDTHISRVRDITKEQVDAAVRKYFSIDKSITVVAGTLS